ncbi:MAG: acyl-CoA dehydrogenase family protein, partial [Acidimicrobiia bacterium]|nr:acyl-CoA dehydrogenase family protein [Acidimicrobiia bacterium]
MSAPAGTESPELADFRASADAWCNDNFERRSVDINEFKRRFSISSISEKDERAQVARAQAGQKAVFEAGFAGLAVPTQYGGQGLTTQHQRIFAQVASRYVIDTGIFSVSIGMVLPTLLAHGTEEQKLRLIPPMLRGDDIWCQLFSEPGAGSDLAGLTTKAELDGETWCINGQKVWNSSAESAEWGMLL